MSDNNSIRAPVIQPIRLKEYETKQSRYPVVPQIPFNALVWHVTKSYVEQFQCISSRQICPYYTVLSLLRHPCLPISLSQQANLFQHSFRGYSSDVLTPHRDRLVSDLVLYGFLIPLVQAHSAVVCHLD